MQGNYQLEDRSQILLKFFKDKKITNRLIEKQLQGEKVKIFTSLFAQNSVAFFSL